MQLKPEEISKIIKSQIKNYGKKIDQSDVGTVLQIGDGIAHVSGLEKCMSNELVRFSTGAYGMALNLEERFSVGRGHAGQLTRASRKATPWSALGRWYPSRSARKLLGRVVNALGQPVDGKGPIASAKEHCAHRAQVAPWHHRAQGRIPSRLQTGIKAIDAMIPIGRGQRELIIGDRQTGKTAIAVDTILNQKGKDVHLHLRGHRPEARPP